VRSLRVFRAKELIIKTSEFTPTHGGWSFITLEGEIEILEHDRDTYHIALKPQAVLMVYRHNESGIQAARLYMNPDEAEETIDSPSSTSRPEVVIVLDR